jgi:outer membrane protein TolC
MAQDTKERKKALLAEDLGGRSIQWWQDKVHDQMRVAQAARGQVTEVTNLLEAARAEGETAKGRVTVLEARLASAEADLNQAVGEMARLNGRIAELEAAELGPEDADDIFGQMAAMFEGAFRNMQKTFGLA